MSDSAMGIPTDRYDHGSAAATCGVTVVERRKLKAMEYRVMTYLFLVLALSAAGCVVCCSVG